MPKRTISSSTLEHIFTSQLMKLVVNCPPCLQAQLSHTWSWFDLAYPQRTVVATCSRWCQQKHHASSTLRVVGCCPQLSSMVFSDATWCNTISDCCSRKGHVWNRCYQNDVDDDFSDLRSFCAHIHNHGAAVDIQ